MEATDKRKWISITLLSIVVPIGLLATFRLTGILHEPPTIAETITTDTIYWNMSRPTWFLSIEEKITNAYINGVLSGSLTICPTSYWENDGMLDYNDGLWLKLTANANTNVGFICSMSIKSSETDEYAVLHFVEYFSNSTKLNKLVQKKVADGSHLKKAIFEAISIDQPKECALKMQPLWMFSDVNNVDHWTTITLEIVHFNGTIYRLVNIPIRLGVIAL